jgi:hypothetical protein
MDDEGGKTEKTEKDYDLDGRMMVTLKAMEGMLMMNSKTKKHDPDSGSA